MNLSAWTSRTETPGILAVFVGIEVVVWEMGALVMSKSRSAEREMERSLDIHLFGGRDAGSAGKRALGITIRRSRDAKGLDSGLRESSE